MSEFLCLWLFPPLPGVDLAAAALRLSPRVQMVAPALAVLDFTGLRRLHGPAEAAVEALPFPVRFGIAAQPALALLAAKGGLGRILPGQERARLAPLPLAFLAGIAELTAAVAPAEEVAAVLELLGRWGIRTLGELAALPPGPLSQRLSPAGLHLRRLAAGEVGGLLCASPETEEVAREVEFDPPVEDLETCRFVLRQQLAPLCAELDRHDQVVERVELRLFLRGRANAAAYGRDFLLPTRDLAMIARQLELALEAHPPAAEVHGLRLACAVTSPRRIQTRLFASAAPDPEKMPKTLARLAQLLDDPERRGIGSPRLLDSHRPEAFELRPFEEVPPALAAPPATPRLALRRLRPPREWRPRRGETIVRRSGPWRSSGGWWRSASDAWDCDEWDVEIEGQGVLRLLHDRQAGKWYVIARYD